MEGNFFTNYRINIIEALTRCKFYTSEESIYECNFKNEKLYITNINGEHFFI